jgi:hypothetical protein
MFDARSISLDSISRPCSQIGPDIKIVKKIGKGANNVAYKVKVNNNDKMVLRAPRRDGDTQKKDTALWELKHMLVASKVGASPPIYDSWFAKHGTGQFPSGLYTLTKMYTCDLESALTSKRREEERLKVLRSVESIKSKVTSHLWSLAKEKMFMYDLKPGNIVVDFDSDSCVDAKIIDFGKDFCEWDGDNAHLTSSSPLISMMKKRILLRKDIKTEEERDEFLSFILFVTMMIILSATTTKTIYEEKYYLKIPKEDRKRAHPFTGFVTLIWEKMREKDKSLVKSLLRCDDVRASLGHYHGRRNAGTKRTIRFAKGLEN